MRKVLKTSPARATATLREARLVIMRGGPMLREERRNPATGNIDHNAAYFATMWATKNIVRGYETC